MYHNIRKFSPGENFLHTDLATCSYFDLGIFNNYTEDMVMFNGKIYSTKINIAEVAGFW